MGDDTAADHRPARLGRPSACLALFLLVATVHGVHGQAAEPYEPVRRDPIGTRLINAASPFTLGARTLEVIFTHRFQQPVQDGGSSNLWGLDSGSDTGIGLELGVTDHLDLSVYRSSFQENYELAGKFLVLEQAPRVPLSIGIRAGADLVGRAGVEDSTRPFGQLLLARRLRPGVTLLAAPSWVADTPRLQDAWNVPLGITFELPGSYLVELEYVPENRDLDESVEAWHLAFSKSVGRHIFEVVLGNSRATTVDQLLGGDSAAGYERDDVRLGFNLVRDFGF